MAEKKESSKLKGQVNNLGYKSNDDEMIIVMDQISRTMMTRSTNEKSQLELHDNGAVFGITESPSDDDTVKKPVLLPFNLHVLNAVTSLIIKNHKKRITPAMIYRAMTGKTVKKVNPGMQNDIAEAINKMGHISVTYDFTHVEKIKDLFPHDQLKGSTTLMSYETYDINANGSTQKAFKFLEMPIIALYAIAIKHVAKVKVSLLNIKKYNIEEDTWDDCYMRHRHMVITIALIRRIIAMMRNKKIRRIIDANTLIYGIINACDDIMVDRYGNISPKTEKDLLGYVVTVLQYWSHIGFIKGFKSIKHNRNYEITFENTKHTNDVYIDDELDVPISFW